MYNNNQFHTLDTRAWKVLFSLKTPKDKKNRFIQNTLYMANAKIININ